MEYLFYAAMPYSCSDALFFIYKWLLCKVTGLVFIIIDAYYIIETFLNRERAVVGLWDRGGMGILQWAERSNAKSCISVWCEDARWSKDTETKQGPEAQ